MLETSEPWLQCTIALAWIFGKRINEILRIKREDIYTDENYLYVRFFVSKKETRKDLPVPKPYLKKITLKNPHCKFIVSYIDQFKEGYIFPANTQPRVKRFLDKRMNVWREYQREGGHITPEAAYYHLKRLAPKTWWHLFRESLATEMAERGATEEKLMHWFDWDRVDTAHQYVKRGTKLTEEYSERIW
ncbi:site-specific integrase [Candidatus Bathyarchaeota archaeon]|nr:site-specific integrase [Candidatus Bathyarchaeota archaeon]